MYTLTFQNDVLTGISVLQWQTMQEEIMEIINNIFLRIYFMKSWLRSKCINNTYFMVLSKILHGLKW